MSKRIEEKQYTISRINTKVINYGVYIMKSSEKLLYRLILLCAGGAVGLIYYGGLFKKNGVETTATTISNLVVFLLIGLFANKYFYKSIVSKLKKKRINTLKTQFCAFSSALANALTSGMNMHDALNAVYNDLLNQYSNEAYIVLEVNEIINGMNNNIAVEVMLEDFGTRSGIEDITNFAKVFATCYRNGGDIKSVVQRTTNIISEKVMISSEIETAITSNKMQMNIMNVLPIVILFMMRMMSKDFAASFATIIGVIGLTVSAGLTFAAYKMGQKIMDIKG